MVFDKIHDTATELIVPTYYYILIVSSTCFFFEDRICVNAESTLKFELLHRMTQFRLNETEPARIYYTEVPCSAGAVVQLVALGLV